VSFRLDPQLEKDTFLVGDLPLSRVLMMNNSRFPWLILAPRRNGLRELFELDTPAYTILMDEVRSVSEKFAHFCAADKMNIAALGNRVPQFHIHIIARFTQDAAWPDPVWNSGIDAIPFSSQEAAAKTSEIRRLLGL